MFLFILARLEVSWIHPEPIEWLQAIEIIVNTKKTRNSMNSVIAAMLSS